MKKFVVAGSYHQAIEWIKADCAKRWSNGETSITISDYTYVSCAADLRGYQDPRGVFIGTWRDRVDIKEIVEALLIQSVHVNPTLGKIWREVKGNVKPTPKKVFVGHGVTGVWVDEAYSAAADTLSKAIDDEVMQQIMRKINGGNIPTP